MPAISISAPPGRRAAVVDLAPAIERAGFSGIHVPSIFEPMALVASLVHATQRITLATAIQPIYRRHPVDLAQAAAYLSEVSGGRFSLGLGVSHESVNRRLGIDTGRPLADVRAYVAKLRAAAEPAAPVPIVVAALRDRMLGLAAEIGDGAVWANAARSDIARQLATIDVSDGFFIGNMIPTVIDDDRAAARAVHRRTLERYVTLPNYRNYWSAAGYEEEMGAIADALERGDREAVRDLMTDAWLDDCTLAGSASEVRDGVEAWFDAGVTTPILVPSATSGGQLAGVRHLIEAFGPQR